MPITLAIIGILLATGFYIAGTYNSLIKLRVKTDNSWADIDTQLKRRYDLIPNLVETVKVYAAHEAKTLEKVTQARNSAINSQSMEERGKAETMLSSALKTIFAVAENYPDLKANQNFMDLQKNLTEIEDSLQMSRRYYNATVRDLNTKIGIFPANLVANVFKFELREFFQLESEKERQNVDVNFSRD